MKRIDARTAIRALRKVVKEQGADHEQSKCIYFDNAGNPVCIWGHAWKLITGQATTPTHNPVYDFISRDYALFYSRESAEMFNLTPRAASIVAAAQCVADMGTDGRYGRYGGGSWGEALKAAELQYASKQILEST